MIYQPNKLWQILEGDVRDVLRTLPDKRFHCCVTSPPYWGLRDYQLPPSVWGGDRACLHEWGCVVRSDKANKMRGPNGVQKNIAGTVPKEAGQYCRCGAWFGCLGLEPTPEQFVANMVEVFREVWRVLRDDGTLWLNLGDSYAAQGGSKSEENNYASTETYKDQRARTSPPGLKAKDLVGIPWMTAFALRASGWYLRAENIWHKLAPMTESVVDRTTKAHEQVFLFSKRPRYYYDSMPSAEKCEEPDTYPNTRTVWSLSPESFKGAHFATMPTELVRRTLITSTSECGCCQACGSPHLRAVRRECVPTRSGADSKVNRAAKSETSPYHDHTGSIVGNRDPQRHCTKKYTTGWNAGCQCEAPISPCRVLDPFSGAGTTTMVARRLGLHAVGIELNPEYAAMSRKRIRDDQPLLNAEVPA